MTGEEPGSTEPVHWRQMLRSNSTLARQEKPQWKAAVKVRSPSERTYSEGGSLRTARLGNRARSETRSRRSRSPSPGLFGSTAASRAKQREAIAARSRSASTATSGLGRREQKRNRSVSPVRRPAARPPNVPRQEQESKKTSLNSIMKNTERSTSSQSTSSSSYSSVLRSEAETFDNVNKSSVWVAPKENPLDFQYFRKNFLDFKDEYHYCYNSSEYNQEKVRSLKNSKKKVSYADTNKYLSLGFRVL